MTGAAGFIGSSLCEELLKRGHQVHGVDSFTPYYSRQLKEGNLEWCKEQKSFSFTEADLVDVDLSEFLEGVQWVFHQAGQPGVRASWEDGFLPYVNWNILVTQRLLEAARKSRTLSAFVAACSSSVYGTAETFPTRESTVPVPVSPYGVTKLAAENLCTLYGTQFGIPTISLRYFTVFGPRQRPDMGIHRLIRANLDNKVFQVFGDGTQQRDFTFVGDVVEANILAAEFITQTSDRGVVVNIGGNSPIALLEVNSLIESLTGIATALQFVSRPPGDPLVTTASNELSHKLLGWTPKTTLKAGIEAQVRSLRSE